MNDILVGEEILTNVMKGMSSLQFVKTGSPHFLSTSLPHHWRANKSLPVAYQVVALGEIRDRTRVTVSAGNEDNVTAQLKNSTTEMVRGVAKFSDLRFVGKSGRGKHFNVVVTVQSYPRQVAVCMNAIKITTDGPREPRNKNKNSVSDDGKGSSSPSTSEGSCSSLYTHGTVAATRKRAYSQLFYSSERRSHSHNLPMLNFNQQEINTETQESESGISPRNSHDIFPLNLSKTDNTHVPLKKRFMKRLEKGGDNAITHWKKSRVQSFITGVKELGCATRNSAICNVDRFSYNPKEVSHEELSKSSGKVPEVRKSSDNFSAIDKRDSANLWPQRFNYSLFPKTNLEEESFKSSHYRFTEPESKFNPEHQNCLYFNLLTQEIYANSLSSRDYMFNFSSDFVARQQYNFDYIYQDMDVFKLISKYGNLFDRYSQYGCALDSRRRNYKRAIRLQN